MSNIVLSLKQIADLSITLQECVNNKTSKKFNNRTFDNVVSCPLYQDSDVETYNKRIEDIKQFIKESVKWNVLSYNARYDVKPFDDGVTFYQSAVDADGDCTRMEQAAFSFMCLLYNSDFTSHLLPGEHEDLAKEFKEWEKKAEELERRMAVWFMHRDCNKAKAKWIY